MTAEDKFFGLPSNSQLIYEVEVAKPYKLATTTSYYVGCEAELPITGIDATDLGRDSKRGTVEIFDGGLSQNLTALRLRPIRNKPLRYSITFYAEGYNGPILSVNFWKYA